jgi:hypothetical protein
VRVSVSKIKSRPLQLVLGEVLIEMEEPSVVLPPRKGGLPKPQGLAAGAQRYSTGDRIGDGLSVTARRVVVVVRSKGPLKDAPVGAWTPPDLVLELFDVEVVSCDAQGHSHGGDLAKLYKLANSVAAGGGREVMVYKKATMQRLVLKLIPALARYRAQTSAEAQASAAAAAASTDLPGPKLRGLEPLVLMDETPGPLQVGYCLPVAA